jgi:hypothetical protein
VELFIHRLALEMRIHDVEAWKRRLTVRQIRQWMAYWRVEPFGDQWRMAGRAALTAAAGFGAKVEADSEERFLPSFREQPQTFEQMRAELMKIPAFSKQLRQVD